MHEITFIDEIIAILKENLKGFSGKDVIVNVRLSPFSHVSPKSLEEAFVNFINNTEFKGAKIVIMPLEVLLSCKKCKGISYITRPDLNCPKCGSKDIDVKIDREFYIESIEIHEK